MSARSRVFHLLFCLWMPLFLAAAPATQPAAPRAARSIHLAYSSPPAMAFYNEVTVRESTPGSYLCAAGTRMDILEFRIWGITRSPSSQSGIQLAVTRRQPFLRTSAWKCCMRAKGLPSSDLAVREPELSRASISIGRSARPTAFC